MSPSAVDPVALGDDLMDTLSALRRLVRRQLRPGLADLPLRGAQVELLRLVSDRPGIGVAAAARSLQLAANSVSTLVNQLADLNMLVRETDPADRRAIRLHLTEAAARRLADWRAARSALIGAEVAALDDADRQAIAAALPALHALLTNLDKRENPDDPIDGP